MGHIELNDHDFSVWQLVSRVEQTSILLNQRRTMNIISHAIEDVSLSDGVPTRVYAGFQRMSRFLPQQERYTRLARVASPVYVFGIPDVKLKPIPGITYVHLARHSALAREWFLVSTGARYSSALATQEQTHIDDPDELRQFKGIWTFEMSIVSLITQWLDHVLDARPVDTEKLDLFSQRMLMNKTITRLDEIKTAARYRGAIRHEIELLQRSVVNEMTNLLR